MALRQLFGALGNLLGSRDRDLAREEDAGSDNEMDVSEYGGFPMPTGRGKRRQMGTHAHATHLFSLAEVVPLPLSMDDGVRTTTSATALVTQIKVSIAKTEASIKSIVANHPITQFTLMSPEVLNRELQQLQTYKRSLEASKSQLIPSAQIEPHNQELQQVLEQIAGLIDQLDDNLHILHMRLVMDPVYVHYRQEVLIAADASSFARQSFKHAYAAFLDVASARRIDFVGMLTKLDEYQKCGVGSSAGSALMQLVFKEFIRRLNHDDEREKMFAAFDDYFAAEGSYSAGRYLCERICREYANQIDINIIKHDSADDKKKLTALSDFLKKHVAAENLKLITDAEERQVERKNMLFLKIYTALHKAQAGSGAYAYRDIERLSSLELAAYIEAHAQERGEKSRTAFALRLCKQYHDKNTDADMLALYNAMYEYVQQYSETYFQQGLRLMSSSWAEPFKGLTSMDDLQKKKVAGDKYLPELEEWMNFNGTRSQLIESINNSQPKLK